MVTSAQAFKRFGDPKHETSMVLWDVPPTLAIGVLPNRIYCNKLMVKPLTHAFGNVISRGYLEEVRTWDGCFNIRKKKGSSLMSLHSWGLAIDINSRVEPEGPPEPPTMSIGLVRCFTDAGFEWGGLWRCPDGMHFQLEKI